MKHPGVITGLRREAACLDGLAAQGALSVLCAGANAARARAHARQLIREGCVGLISFGLAGGLDPARPPGTLVLADRVLGADGQSLPTDAAWRERLGHTLRAAGKGFPFEIAVAPLAGSDQVIAEVAAKAELFAKTGAVAVDMESHGVGEIAQAGGVPFLVLRAIADPAGMALPFSVRRSVGVEGGVRVLPILGGLALRPREIAAVAALAGHSRKALRSLRQAATLGAPDFRLGFPSGHEKGGRPAISNAPA